MIKSNLTQVKSINSLLMLLVFIFSPLIAVYISVSNYKAAWAKNIVWLFSGFYGYTFVIGNSESDINRYKRMFDDDCNMQLSVKYFFDSLLREGKLDFIQPSLSYITSVFTSNFNIYLMIIGLIFGFFFSRNIWNVLSLGEGKIMWYGVFFIVLFAFIFAVWDINVMRFTLAAQIFFYGIFNHLVNKKKWGLLFIFIAPFMHFSFCIAVVVYLLYKLIGNFTKLYFVCFLVSFTVSELNFDVFKSQLSFLPQNYIEKTEDYANEDYKELKDEKTEKKNFRGKFYQLSLSWAVGILLTYIYINRGKIKGNLWIENLLAFTLLFIAVFNVLSVIPSMNRFQFMGYLFAFALFFSFFNGVVNKNEKKIVIICTPFILFYFFMKIRIGLEFTGLFTMLGGPISALFNDGDIALIEFLK